MSRKQVIKNNVEDYLARYLLQTEEKDVSVRGFLDFAEIEEEHEEEYNNLTADDLDPYRVVARENTL